MAALWSAQAVSSLEGYHQQRVSAQRASTSNIARPTVAVTDRIRGFGDCQQLRTTQYVCLTSTMHSISDLFRCALLTLNPYRHACGAVLCCRCLFLQILWAVCVYMEAVSVLPQLRMMQNSKVVERFTAHYVFCLGLSRFFSCAHWILQLLEGNKYLLHALGSGLWPVLVLLSEVVQTFILADFW
jgi:hypothetical protein